MFLQAKKNPNEINQRGILIKHNDENYFYSSIQKYLNFDLRCFQSYLGMFHGRHF